MKIAFSKYHGAGNDFILMDNRDGRLQLAREQVALLCHRRYGVGADGLMLVQHSERADFEMIYFNSDGRVSSFCGNGGRCIASYAIQMLGMGPGRAIRIGASDGIHHAELLEGGEVCLSMRDVDTIRDAGDHVILDTGSPHYVSRVNGLASFEVTEAGRAIRNLPEFGEAGINVNFVETCDGVLQVRTYERGVEAETFACGTGITAAAIASTGVQTGAFVISLRSKEGHRFEVRFDKPEPGRAENVRLTGPVQHVFDGNFQLVEPA